MISLVLSKQIFIQIFREFFSVYTNKNDINRKKKKRENCMYYCFKYTERQL